ncbi:MAG: MmgE/PrpD family protein, partial [Desulfobacterales bacterium]
MMQPNKQSDDFLNALTEFAFSITLDRIPTSVVKTGRRILVDTTGVILAAINEHQVQALADQMADASMAPCSSILGSHRRTDAMWAALVHGTAGVWHELDGGHRFSGGHPAVYAVAAGLAVAERQAVSGGQLLEAIIAGYEVAARVGLATTLRPGMDTHGSWPALAAATTAGLLMGYDRSQLRETLNVFTSLNLASSNRAAYEGATVRNAYAGFGAAMGVLAADLVNDGFTGERDGISTIFGNIAGVFLDAEKVLEDLGKRWEIERGYFRVHACARCIHPALDALISISKAHDFLPEEIEHLDVSTYSLAATLNDAAPQNPSAARFSMPHAMASYLILRETSVANFSQKALQNDKIRALARRIAVNDDQGMTRRTPAQRPASVRVVLRDGKTLEASTVLASGEYDHAPLGDEELSEKFLSLASDPLGQQKTT